MVNDGSSPAIHLASLSWQWSALRQQNGRGQLISHMVSSQSVGTSYVKVKIMLLKWVIIKGQNPNQHSTVHLLSNYLWYIWSMTWC